MVKLCDASRRTAEEFLQELFEFEFCAECGGDVEDHRVALGPFGLWIAICRFRRVRRSQ